jgi:hypothetical protein
MKRVFVGTVVMLLLVLAFVSGGYAAAKSYQFSGVVKAVDSSSLSVEKSAKETWQFEVTRDTKGGTPKVGDRVTVYYKMAATEIDANAAPSTAAKKKK